MCAPSLCLTAGARATAVSRSTLRLAPSPMQGSLRHTAWSVHGMELPWRTSGGRYGARHTPPPPPPYLGCMCRWGRLWGRKDSGVDQRPATPGQPPAVGFQPPPTINDQRQVVTGNDLSVTRRMVVGSCCQANE